MMASLVALISLNLTASLIQNYNVVAGSLPISGATATTPIAIVSPAHGVPLGRMVHGIVTGVEGTVEANGLWIATPIDPDTFTLSVLDAQGLVVQSVGVNLYTGGGSLQYAFPDYSILLGRRNVDMGSSIASPRIVFVPTVEEEWTFEAYGGVGAPADLPPVRGSVEAQAAKQRPQAGIEPTTFEVFVTGSSNPPDPDFGDFEATQFITHALYSRFVRCFWAGELQGAPRSVGRVRSKIPGTKTQRSQQWSGIIEFQQPVYTVPIPFVPVGTFLQITVEPVNPAAEDPITFNVEPQ